MLPRTVRVKFQKVDALIFISHLDLMRFMTRALVRAGIPVVFTEGFNPHPKLTFGLPLSVGTASVGELMEFKLREEMENAEILRRLRDNLPSSLLPLAVYDAPAGVKLSSIAYASYRITLDHEIDAAMLEADTIMVSKASKTGEKLVDIKPLMRDCRYDGNSLTVTLCADSRNYCNPELLVKVLGAQDYSICRLSCLCSDGVSEFH